MTTRTTKIKLSSDQINQQIRDLAQEIATDYQGKSVILVGILKGSFIFLADLIRELWQAGLTDCEVDFMGVTSYGPGTESTRNPHITKDLEMDITGRHVLVVEDIIDTGHSLDALLRILSQRGAKSLKTVLLLSKQSRRELAIPIDYLGFEIEGWVEGYGLDTNELYRGRPEVVEVIS